MLSNPISVTHIARPRSTATVKVCLGGGYRLPLAQPGADRAGAGAVDVHSAETRDSGTVCSGGGYRLPRTAPHTDS